MRHLKSGRKFNMPTSHRNAMLRNLVTSLLEHGQIVTTVAKAKELRGLTERVLTLGKKGAAAFNADPEGAGKVKRVHHVRQARLWVTNLDVLKKVFSEYAARFETRPGGYTRVIKLGNRIGDNAPMAKIELVD